MILFSFAQNLFQTVFGAKSKKSAATSPAYPLFPFCQHAQLAHRAVKVCGSSESLVVKDD
jgi:hypothetical protein